ncbi:MAG: S41 family peptidase [Anaerolineales bacterium]
MKTRNQKKHLKSFLGLFALSAIWLLVGWTLRGYALGTEMSLVEQARQHLLTQFAEESPTSRQLSYAAVRGMLAQSGDPYAALLEAQLSQRYRDDLDGLSGGIGVVATAQNGRMLVTRVIPGDPAEQAGLQAGDVILGVDGLVFDEFTSESEAALLIRGPVGSTANLLVQRGDEILWLKAERKERQVASASMLEGGVAYLEQYTFSPPAAPLVKTYLQLLLKVNPTGIIWDLRTNAGGSLETTQEILGYFIENELLYTAELKGGERQQFFAGSQGIATQTPLVVLIGAQTYSSAELAAAAIQSHGRGILIGETTYGKAAIQTSVPLVDGSLLKYTIAYWRAPSGESFNLRGVPPDIVVSDDPDTSQDEVLEAALEYLRQLSQP